MISVLQDVIEPFNECAGCAGVYIYFENDSPVYVGSAGKSNRDLKFRLGQYLNEGDTGATLRINIQKIDRLNPQDAVKKIKTFTIKVIICGSNNPIDFTGISDLEKLLIKLLQPKYNINFK